MDLTEHTALERQSLRLNPRCKYLGNDVWRIDIGGRFVNRATFEAVRVVTRFEGQPFSPTPEPRSFLRELIHRWFHHPAAV